MPIERRTGFFESDGEKIYFEDCGAGEVIIFCHGAGGNHANWFQQVPYFSAKRRTIVWDQRGFGRSTNIASEAGPDASAADLLRLMDHLSIEIAHLVGQSMGGYAILEAAIKHPDRCTSIVMADSLGGIPVLTKDSDADGARHIVGMALLNQSLPVDSAHPCLDTTFAARSPAQSYLFLQLASLTPPTPVECLQRLAAKRHGLEDISGIVCPTLFVVGENDKIFPPDAMRSAAALIKHAKVNVISNAGHSPYFETADEWNRIVEAFFNIFSIKN